MRIEDFITNYKPKQQGVHPLVYILIMGTVYYVLNHVLVSKNSDADEYVATYMSQQIKVKVLVDNKEFSGKEFGHTRYFKKAIFYKGIFGGSFDYTFKNGKTGKYFKIMRFDQYKDVRSLQTNAIEGEELYVMVDSLQYNSPSYGSIINPYLVFSYKGVNTFLTIEVTNFDKKQPDGYYVQEEAPLAPSAEEYRYNVEQYLAYIMPEEEFNKRFNITHWWD